MTLIRSLRPTSLAFIALGLALAAPTASASVLTTSQTLSFVFDRDQDLIGDGSNDVVTLVDADPLRGGLNRVSTTLREPLRFDAFDGSTGTLIGVEISFDTEYRLNGSVRIRGGSSHHNGDSAKGRIGQTMTILLNDPDGAESKVQARHDIDCTVGEVEGNSTTAACLDFETTGITDFSGILDLSTVIGTPDLLSSFDSSDGAPPTGKVNLLARMFRFSDLRDCYEPEATDCRMNNGQNSLWRGDVTVAYTYQVPEPGPIGLLGLGLAWIALRRRGGPAGLTAARS